MNYKCPISHKEINTLLWLFHILKGHKFKSSSRFKVHSNILKQIYCFIYYILNVLYLFCVFLKGSGTNLLCCKILKVEASPQDVTLYILLFISFNKANFLAGV